MTNYQFTRTLLCVQPLALECIGVYQQIRLRHDVEADRADSLADGIGEFVVVAEQVQARLHRRQHIVERRLSRIDAAARRIERTRRLVREEQLDVLEALAGRPPRRARNAAACRRGSFPASAPPRPSCVRARAEAGRPACGTSWARTFRRARRRATAPPGTARRSADGTAWRQRLAAVGRRRDDVEVFVVPFDPVQRPIGVKYSPSLLATSPTDTQTGTSGVPRHDVFNGVEGAVDIA